MKIVYQTLAIIVAAIILLACSGQPATTYTIEGNIEGLEDNAKIELVPGATHSDEKAVAEAIVSNGKFTLKGSTPEPRLFFIRIADSYGSRRIVVENSVIKLTGKIDQSTRNGKKYYDFKNIKIEGSPSNDLYLKKVAPREILDSLYNAYHVNNKEILDALSKARQEKNQQALDSLNKTDAAKQLAADEKNFFATVNKTIQEIIISNKDSWWGPLLMLDQMSYFTPEQEDWYNSFSQEVKDSYYGKIVKKELFPEGFSGKPLPVFKLIDKKTNKEVTFAELSKNKKYILLDFWASWCAPCRKEIPNLKKLYEKYSSKGFEIVSISIDSKEADWQKALKEEQLPWPNFLDTEKAANTFNVKTIPAMFLIDEKGVIVNDKLRGKDLEEKLAELFK